LKKRQRLLINYCLINGILLLLLLTYLIVLRFTDPTPLSILTQCPAHTFFGIYCPGCGGTRAIKSILTGHWIQAFICNPAVTLFSFLFVIYDVRILMAILYNCPTLPWPKRWMWISLSAIFLVNFLIRNYFLLFQGIDYLSNIQ